MRRGSALIRNLTNNGMYVNKQQSFVEGSPLRTYLLPLLQKDEENKRLELQQQAQPMAPMQQSTNPLQSALMGSGGML